VARPALFVFALACTQCAASYVRGRVTDCRDSSPLEGADVQLASGASGAQWSPEETGSDGAYAFQVAGARSVVPVTLTAVKKGYQSVQKTYDAVPAGAEDVCLQPTIR
jgi:hypothetical protein